MSMNYDRAKGRLVQINNVTEFKFNKPWKLNREDVDIRKAILCSTTGGVSCNEPDGILPYSFKPGLVVVTDSTNAFDDKLSTYSDILLSSEVIDVGLGTLNYRGTAYIYLNIPIELSTIEMLIEDEVNEDLTNGPRMTVVYGDSSVSDINPIGIEQVAVLDESAGEYVMYNKYTYSLDSTKKTLGFMFGSFSTSANSWGGKIHGFYVYVDLSTGGAADSVQVKDSSGTIIDPSTSGKQDTAITHLSNIETNTTGLATESTLSSIDGKVATEATLQDVKTNTTGVATEATVASIDGKVATETTLTSIDGKVSTEAKQDTAITHLSNIDTKVATESTLATVAKESTLGDIKDRLDFESYFEHVDNGDDFNGSVLWSGISDGSKKYILFDTTGGSSSARYILLSMNASFNGAIKVKVYQSPTISSNGTSVSMNNINMDSTKSLDISIYKDPSISSTGSAEGDGRYVPGYNSGGFSPTISGSSASVVAVRFLKHSAKILVEIENVSGGTIDYGSVTFRIRKVIP